MKKFFTLIAAALMAVGANAQVLSFDQVYDAEQAAGTVNEITMGDSEFNAVFVGGSKAKIASKSLTFKVNAEDAGENFKMQWAPGGGITKLTGERSVTITVSKKGTLTIYPRSAGKDDRAFTVQQNGATILEGTAYYAAQFEDTYYKAYAVEIETGTANILATSAINISALKFEASSEQGGEEPGDDTGDETKMPSWIAGTAVGTWTAEGPSEKAPTIGYLAKYNNNKTTVSCVTFPNSIISEGAWQCALKVAGEFKKGDVITIQPFTAMSTSDFTGGAKSATILLYSSDIKKIADLTGSTATAKTVTDGHEEEGDPKEFTYTLENDYTDLYFGRGGNTRINLMKVVITRENPSVGINTVDATVNNGKWYNLQGQEVAAPTKGLFIKDGKKYMLK